MATPSEVLTPDEQAEAAYIESAIQAGHTRVREIIAEVLLWRKVQSDVRRNPYLRANPAVKKDLDRMPGSRFVPAAYLPTRKGR
jgi:hypothetical protein